MASRANLQLAYDLALYAADQKLRHSDSNDSVSPGEPKTGPQKEGEEVGLQGTLALRPASEMRPERIELSTFGLKGRAASAG